MMQEREGTTEWGQGITCTTERLCLVKCKDLESANHCTSLHGPQGENCVYI